MGSIILAEPPRDTIIGPEVLNGGNFSALFGLLAEGAYCVDRERRIVHWNTAAERLTGYSTVEVLGRRCFDGILCHVDERGVELCAFAAWCPMHLTARDGLPRQNRVSLLRKDGRRIPVRIRTMPLSDATGAIIGALQLFDEEIDKLREQLEDASRAAYFDCLTGLPNRRFIDARMAECIEEFERYGWQFAVFVADIDHFKYINDTFGHETGDRAIGSVLGAIATACRSSDVVGRYGGDEAVGIVRNIDRERLEHKLNRVLDLVRHTVIPGCPRELASSVSIGATVVRPGDTVRSLMKRADAGLYRSKRDGRDRHTVV